MNVANIIKRLEIVAKNATDSYTLMLLSKVIEKLKVGTITVIPTFTQLPAAASIPVGEIYLVEQDEDLYVNQGTYWKSVNNEAAGIVPMTWGLNTGGRLGDGTTVAKSSPVSVIGGIVNWAQVSGGSTHSLGITDTGIAYAWGDNTNGRLGDTTVVSKLSPVSVAGGFTDWVQVTAGGSHSLGLRSNGTAYAWGNNASRQLGDGTAVSKVSPVQIGAGVTWAQLSAGGSHSLGVATDGAAYAWGLATSGQIGDAVAVTTSLRSVPTAVVGDLTWARVSAGGTHSLGITSSGLAYSWGLGTSGQLGDGTAVTKSSPVSVVGGITNWNYISAGTTHSIGVTSDGIAYGWGLNTSGQLGDGTTANTSSPVSVIGGITNWKQVGTGAFHTIGITTEGFAYAWGLNTSGRLGNGTVAPASSPDPIASGILKYWVQVSAGDSHSLGLTRVVKSRLD